MNSGFFDQNVDVGDTYVTRDWLISRYPDLANNLLINFQKRIGFAGRGFTGKSPYSLSTGEQVAPGGTLNENTPTGAWSNFARNGTLGIRPDQSLWSWGLNNYGQLGDRTNINRSSPVQVSVGTYWKSAVATYGRAGGIDINDNLYMWGLLAGVRYSWSSVATGYQTYGIRSDGTLWEWGDIQGAAGGRFLSSAYTSSPVQIGSDTTWSKVFPEQTEYNGAAAIKTDGSLWTRGPNTFGQLGLNDVTSRSVFTQVGTTSSWTTVATGAGRNSSGFNSGFMLAIRSDGTLWAWGDNTSGCLGQNDRVHRSSPTQIGSSSWISVAIFDAGSAAAIRSDGALFTWGDNGSGQLGQNDRVHRSTPAQVGTSSWTAVAGFGSSLFGAAFAIRSDGSIWAWGYNGSNALGTGSLNYVPLNRSSPVQVDSGSWVDIKPGYGSLAKKSDGTIWGWGSNFYGQLGPNAYIPTLSWAFVAGGGGYFASSFRTKFGITSTGALYRWGSTSTGSLGLGTNATTGEGIPTNYDNASWTALCSTNSGAVLALKSDGSLWSWGYNSSGELGLGDKVHRSSLTQVGTSSWTAISANESTSAAIRKDGALFVWGDSSYGQVPVQPLTPMSWISITTNLMGTVYAIRSDYTLWGWGYDSTSYNVTSLLLQSVAVHRSSPVQIGTSSWTAIAAGYAFGSSSQYSVFAIKPDKTLWFWGNNEFGLRGENYANNFDGYSSPVQIGTSSWNAVATNGKTALAIRSDGRLFGWGRNDNYLVGDASGGVHRSAPVQTGTESWTQVAITDRVAGAIRSDGLLATWGSDLSGTLGYNTTNISIQAPNWYGIYNLGYSWTSVAAGAGGWGHIFGVKTNGSLWAIGGYNSSGELGLNDTVHRSSPTQIGTSSWTSVGAYRAIRSDGSLWGWGSNSNGELGQSDLVLRSSPVQIGTGSWSTLQSGSQLYGSAAIRSDGALFIWGSNSYGSVGDITTISRSSPVLIGNQSLSGNMSSPVQLGTSSWTQVVASYTMTAIRSDGGLFGWGINGAGELGLDDTVNRSSPVQVGTSSWSMVGGAFTGTYPFTRATFAIRSDGRLFTWGFNNNRVQGRDDFIHRSSPVQLGSPFSSYSWTSVTSSGYLNGFAIRSDGALFGWGFNEYGKIGAGSGSGAVNSYISPVQIGTSSWTAVSALTEYSYAIRSDGALFGWGRNDSSNSLGDIFIGHAHRSSPVLLGSGTRLKSVPAPIQILSGSWTSIASGNNTTGFVQSNQIYMMGGNEPGKLGDGTSIHRSSPVIITSPNDSTPQLFTGYGSGNKARQFDLGISHTAIIRSDGTLWMQGLNTTGQLGVNNVTDPGGAVQVGTLSDWNVVSCGIDHTLAIKTDGTLWSWGVNDHGQLGDISTAHRSSPVQVGTDTNWRYICAGSKMSGALTVDNKLYLWGRNNYGQIGDGTIVHRSSPVQIGSEAWSKFVAFNRGDAQSSYAIDIGGNLFAWGEDTANSLGVTSTAHRSSPVQVATAGYAALDVFSANSVGAGTGVALYVVTDGGVTG